MPVVSRMRGAGMVHRGVGCRSGSMVHGHARFSGACAFRHRVMLGVRCVSGFGQGLMALMKTAVPSSSRLVALMIRDLHEPHYVE